MTRLPAAAAAALAVLVPLAACSGAASGPVPTRSDTSTTITWYASSIDQNERDYRQVLIDAYRNSHPSIKIDLVSQQPSTDTIRSELATAITASSPSAGLHPPDVYLGDVIWPAEFAKAGLARPLDSDFDAAFWNRFPPQLLTAMRYQGRTYAVPFFADQGMLYYRTDLAKKPPTTWEELIAQSKQLLGSHRVKYGYLWQGDQYEGLTCNWTEVLADAGGRTLNDAGTAAQVTTPAAHRALHFMQALIRDGVSPRQVTQFQETDTSQLFVTGQVAFMRGWNSGMTRINIPSNQAIYNKVAVAPLPTFADQQGAGYSTVGGWSLYINPHTKVLPAAQAFVKWLTDLQAQRILARFSHIPTTIEARKDPQAENNKAVALGLQVQQVARPSQTPAYHKVSQAIYTTLGPALDGDPNSDAALHTLDVDIRRILTASGATTDTGTANP
jgi:multiple sugar transport system substrate-binding protein